MEIDYNKNYTDCMVRYVKTYNIKYFLIILMTGSFSGPTLAQELMLHSPNGYLANASRLVEHIPRAISLTLVFADNNF